MKTPRNFPWIASIFAALGALSLAIYGTPTGLVGTVLIVWAASLWLAAQRPPEQTPAPNRTEFDDAQIGDLLEMSEMPVVVSRKDRVTIANAAARKLLGNHVIGQDIRMTLRHPNAVALIDSRDGEGATISGLTRRRDVWRINRKTLPGDVAVYELVNRTAEADISRAHTDFVANASHELRTPLASIIGYVETLLEEETDASTRERFLATIQREARRLQSLVEDLMSLSRIEAEKHDMPSGELDMSALVERAARDAAGSERSNRLKLDLAPDLAVQGDPQQLEQLVRNLVDNAFKYGSDSEPVVVSLASLSGRRMELAVRDKGDGISPDHLPHLTRRFYRTDPGRSRASGGTGLGLAIVKHIVERHRGKLEIASALGEGTIVSVRLPRARDVSAETN
jgi:two-component system phosphate regulon sensor histidine kinase PhoR